MPVAYTQVRENRPSMNQPFEAADLGVTGRRRDGSLNLASLVRLKDGLQQSTPPQKAIQLQLQTPACAGGPGPARRGRYGRFSASADSAPLSRTRTDGTLSAPRGANRGSAQA